MDELMYGSATAMAQAIRDKRVSAAEVVEAHLQRIEAVNPALNAVVQVAGPRARLEALAADQALARGELRGPLHGVPMTIKDSLDTAGVISTGATRGRATLVPGQDATVVARLRAAGAINGSMAPTPETAAAVRAAAAALVEAGAIVEEDRPAMLERTAELANNLSGGDGRAWVQRLLRQAGTVEIHPLLRQRFDEARAVEVAEFTAVLEDVDRFRSGMLTFMEQYDAILCPTCAYPAPPHGQLMTDAMRKGTSYTSAYNLTGWPGAVVRGGTSPEGLPIGVQVVARPWREDVALAVAQHLETALGGWQRPTL